MTVDQPPDAADIIDQLVQEIDQLIWQIEQAQERLLSLTAPFVAIGPWSNGRPESTPCPSWVIVRPPEPIRGSSASKPIADRQHAGGIAGSDPERNFANRSRGGPRLARLTRRS
jgi:hypothetical protein